MSALNGNREAAMKVLMSRKVELLLGYLVQRIKRTGDDSESSEDGGYLLDLQYVERGLESQSIEAEIVLWTIGSKPLLTKLFCNSSKKPKYFVKLHLTLCNFSSIFL